MHKTTIVEEDVLRYTWYVHVLHKLLMLGTKNFISELVDSATSGWRDAPSYLDLTL